MSAPRPSDDDIPARLAAVEDELARVRTQVRAAAADAGAARLMAAGADRDVSDMRLALRAHTSALNALREDQLDTRAELGEFKAEMREFKAEMTEFRDEMTEFKAEMTEFRDETRRGFALVNQGMATIVEILGRIEGQQ